MGLNINSLSDILDNPFVLTFRESVEKPECDPVYSGKITIWITDKGVIVTGRRSSGKIGNSYFVFDCIGKFLLCTHIRTYKPRNSNPIKITFYPNITYPYNIGERIVKNHIRIAEKIRDEIFNNEGKGIRKNILDLLVNNGCYYQDGADMFFLKRNGFMRVMSYNEFNKVKI